MAKGDVAPISTEDIERAGQSEAERLALEEDLTDVELLRELVDGEDAGEDDVGEDDLDNDAPEIVLPRYIAPPVEGYEEKMAALDRIAGHVQVRARWGPGLVLRVDGEFNPLAFSLRRWPLSQLLLELEPVWLFSRPYPGPPSMPGCGSRFRPAAIFESKLPGIGHINVREKVMGADVPTKLKQDIRTLGGENDTAGAWHNGEVWVFTENIRSPEHLAWVILHEARQQSLRATARKPQIGKVVGC